MYYLQTLFNKLFFRGYKIGQGVQLYTRRQYLLTLGNIHPLTEKGLDDLSQAARVMAKDMLGEYPDYGREYKLPLSVWNRAYNIVSK